MPDQPLISNVNSIETLHQRRMQSMLDFVMDIIKKRWWLFLIVGLLGGLAGFFYALKQPVLYQSRLSFALDEGGTGGGGGGGLYSIASQFGLNFGGSNDVFGGDNIITILKSRRVIENALLSIDTLGNGPRTLISYFIEKNKEEEETAGAKVKVEFPPLQPRASFSREQDSVLYRIYSNFEKNYITVWKPDKYLNIFEVKVVSNDETFTKIFTNRLVEGASNFYTDMRSKKGMETLNILEQRVAEMKGNLNTSIASKAAVQDANVNPAFSKAQTPVLKSQANIQTYGAAYSEMFKSLELARYQYLKQIPLFQIIDNAAYPMHKIKTGKLKTAVIFSVLAGAFTFLIFWLIRILKGNNRV